MCDTMVMVSPERVLFAKNSDRDPNEAQCLEWHPRQTHPPGASLDCTWMSIPQVRETYATLLSRPFWMWGAEMGANEHGVVIGNEAVFTREPCAKTGLTGMDLLRLGLERAKTAEAACEVMTNLLATHGQGGGCGHENRRFTYHNSFIVADPRQAFVLETAGREWVVEPVSGVCTISNALTIPGFAARHSDRLKTIVAEGRTRCARTAALLAPASGVDDLFAVLRDHGGQTEPQFRLLNGAMGHPCMHAGGLAAAGQTVASWVTDLHDGHARHWVTATAAPCTSLFKPVYVDQALDEPQPRGDTVDDSLWWQHERFHRGVMRDPKTLLPHFASERDMLEEQWLAEPPDSAEAFATHRRLIAEWLPLLEQGEGDDMRPWWLRRYWAKRNRRAGLQTGA